LKTLRPETYLGHRRQCRRDRAERGRRHAYRVRGSLHRLRHDDLDLGTIRRDPLAAFAGLFAPRRHHQQGRRHCAILRVTRSLPQHKPHKNPRRTDGETIASHRQGSAGASRVVRLEEQVAWVTGGGSAIGEAAAMALAGEGAAIVLTGRRKAPLEERSEEHTSELQSPYD